MSETTLLWIIAISTGFIALVTLVGFIQLLRMLAAVRRLGERVESVIATAEAEWIPAGRGLRRLIELAEKLGLDVIRGLLQQRLHNETTTTAPPRSSAAGRTKGSLLQGIRSGITVALELLQLYDVVMSRRQDAAQDEAAATDSTADAAETDAGADEGGDAEVAATTEDADG